MMEIGPASVWEKQAKVRGGKGVCSADGSSRQLQWWSVRSAAGSRDRQALAIAVVVAAQGQRGDT